MIRKCLYLCSQTTFERFVMTDLTSQTRNLPYGIPAPGYRLPGATRIGRVRLQVADLDRSVSYYQQVIGFEVLEKTENAVSLGLAGDRVPLVELHERAGVAPVPRRGRLGLYHFAILLPDRAALGRFVEHLSKLGVRAGASDHLVSEALYLNDPDGLGIEVYADRPRAEWEIEGRQLAMTTEPLDLQSLVRAAAGVPWQGMPTGTVIGHVHLHVGDIDSAAQFYHQLLGLDKVIWSYPGALFLSAGGYHHHLGVNTWAVGAQPATDDDARLLHWELILPTSDDVRAALASLASGGISPASDGQGLVKDPWGTGLRLIAQPN
jgi:catechol 2,3-dioxygenase